MKGFHIFEKLKVFAGVAYSSRYLPLTNAVVGSSLMMVGDALAQGIENRYSGKEVNINWNRVARLGLIGGCTAIYQHNFYVKLDSWFPAKTTRVIFKKIVIDEIIMGTTTISFFFIVNGWFETGSFGGGVANLKSLFLPAYVADLCYWPFFQAINFYYISPSMRVTYLSTVTIFWNIFLCFLDIHRRETEKRKKMLQESGGKSH